MAAMTPDAEDAPRPGFADPVHDAQQTFRMILQAMARPGTVHACDAGLTPPHPFGPAMAAAALTLVDADTPVWLAPRFAQAATAWLRFHCNAPLQDDPATAAFVLAPGDALPVLGTLLAGEDRYPDRGATALVEVAALESGAHDGWRLSGPGIPDTARLRVAGLPADFRTQWARNVARFPRGVDLILTRGDRVAGLPRTTALEA